MIFLMWGHWGGNVDFPARQKGLFYDTYFYFEFKNLINSLSRKLLPVFSPNLPHEDPWL